MILKILMRAMRYVTVSTDDDDVIVWSVCPTYRNRLTLRAVVLAGIDLMKQANNDLCT